MMDDAYTRAISWVRRHVFLRSDHVMESAGAADKGRPIITDANGQIDATLLAAATLLAKLLTVDGAGSGLDADTLDGAQGSSYQLASGYTAADVLAKLLTVDGAGSGLDADLLDGSQAAAFATSSHNHTHNSLTSLQGGAATEYYHLTATQSSELGASGTWTPVLKFGGASTGITYSVQSGTYAKSGKIVTVDMDITLTSKGSATGNATITGLPHTNAGKTVFVGTAYWTNITNVPNASRIDGATANIVVARNNAGTATILTDADFANNTRLIMSAVYHV